MSTPTTLHQVPLQCRDCRHEWQEAVQLPMNMDAFIPRMKAWGFCPACGSKKVDILLKPPNPFYRPDEEEKHDAV